MSRNEIQAREYAESRAFCSMLRYVSHAHNLIFMNFINTYLYNSLSWYFMAESAYCFSVGISGLFFSCFFLRIASIFLYGLSDASC